MLARSARSTAILSMAASWSGVKLTLAGGVAAAAGGVAAGGVPPLPGSPAAGSANNCRLIFLSMEHLHFKSWGGLFPAIVPAVGIGADPASCGFFDMKKAAGLAVAFMGFDITFDQSIGLPCL